MQGADIYSVLKKTKATNLYHANSVTTSRTFLEQGGLLSRGYVEDHHLKQTPQLSDEIDKKFGIWHGIFLDYVDIHYRAGEKNRYGPVLFQFDLSILLKLGQDTDILVTKKNPVRWECTDPNHRRWFQTKDELAKFINFGDFGQMLVIKTPSEKLDFPNGRALIILDDPKRKLSSGDDAYTHAQNRLMSIDGPVEPSIQPRKCRGACGCVNEYAEDADRQIDLYFT